METAPEESRGDREVKAEERNGRGRRSQLIPERSGRRKDARKWRNEREKNIRSVM